MEHAAKDNAIDFIERIDFNEVNQRPGHYFISFRNIENNKVVLVSRSVSVNIKMSALHRIHALNINLKKRKKKIILKSWTNIEIINWKFFDCGHFNLIALQYFIKKTVLLAWISSFASWMISNFKRTDECQMFTIFLNDIEKSLVVVIRVASNWINFINGRQNESFVNWLIDCIPVCN